MKMNKKGLVKMSGGIVNGAIAGLILLAVLFQVVASLIPTVQTAGATVNATGAPLASLFAPSGVVILILMAALILAVLAATGIGKGKR